MIERRAEIADKRTMVLGAQSVIADFLAKDSHAVQAFLEMIDPTEPGQAIAGDAQGMGDVRAQVWKGIGESGRTLTYKDWM